MTLYSLLWLNTVYYDFIQSIMTLYSLLWLNTVSYDFIQSIMTLYGAIITMHHKHSI